MLVVPMFYDQEGNAARVVYHGLGLRARMEGATATVLGDLLDFVEADGTCRTRVQSMGRRFAEEEARALSVELVEEVLRERGPAGRRSFAAGAP
jgi:UDP:flavonoid glycosyltransferase YjiC (YdhE family)